MKEKFARFVSNHPIWTFVIGCAVILIIPALFTLKVSFLPGYLISGQVGDTIGGTTAPFIGLFSAILVYLSFQEQIKANKLLAKQREEDISIQNINAQITRIEETIKTYSHSQYNQINNSTNNLYGNHAIHEFVIMMEFFSSELKIIESSYGVNREAFLKDDKYLYYNNQILLAINSPQMRGIVQIMNLMYHIITFLNKKDGRINSEITFFSFEILAFIFFNDLKPSLKVFSNLKGSLGFYNQNLFDYISDRDKEIDQILRMKLKSTQNI